MNLTISSNHCRLFAIILLLITLTGQAVAQTGLPLPRFVSLRASEVNMRTGPGIRYPIEWKLMYRHMPVEIVAEFENWRKIREWQGGVGWVHKSMLSGQRWVIIRKGKQTLRRNAKPDARAIARIEKKVIGKLKKCDASWCKIDFSGYSGWMRHNQVWGVYPGETVK
ncbi:MAG: SH3 domain-containing protein [Alphaproteobacteria bacterium]|nr:SH3 domain-containing protein [Alphaproteobacteria bacterium]